MPTAKPRIQVTLTTAQYELLQRLSKLQHRSMSSIVAELWESIHPVLERVAVVLQAAVRAQDSAKEGLRAATEESERQLRPHVAAALGQLDMLTMDFEAVAPKADAAERSGAGPPRTPVPVTRGSGTVPPPPRKRRPKPRPASSKRRKSIKRRARA